LSSRSYYGRPIVKPPVWKPQVPWYLFAGGLTGGSAALSFAAGVAGNDVLSRRAWALTLAGGTASPVLLVTDLGRPERFLNMMRVFKVTSPMSVGSWLLAATGATAAATTSADLFGRRRAARAGRAATALLGLPLATYASALFADSAIPAWHEARRELPFVFAGSAAASAGAAAAIVTPAADAAPACRLAVVGIALASASAALMERRLGRLAAPYRTGAAGRYRKAARALTAAGALALALRGSRRRAALGGSLVLAGAVCERWSIFEAGFQSALDPAQTVVLQRERLERAEH
jgi:formate-dependent nitrite reductase membrane component NrfD